MGLFSSNKKLCPWSFKISEDGHPLYAGAKDTFEVRQSDVPDMMQAMRFALQKGGWERMNAMEQLRAI